MSRRMPFLVSILRTTTSANSFAITIGPSFPPSRGYSDTSPIFGRSTTGSYISATSSPSYCRCWSDEDGHVVRVDQRLVQSRPPSRHFPPVGRPTDRVLAEERV